MIQSRHRLYALFISACILGYVWLLINFTGKLPFFSDGVTVCLFKGITGIPCPSCGSTRSVLHLFQGKIEQALFFNPLGVIVFLIMILTPIWITFDYLLQKDSFFVFYNKAERVLKQKIIAIPLVAIVVINWIWNIYKYI